MLYSILIRNFSYLCSVESKKQRCKTRFPKGGKHKKRKQIMKKKVNEQITMLQYRIQRYQAMGNGAMCQALNGKLQKLLSKQVAM